MGSAVQAVQMGRFQCQYRASGSNDVIAFMYQTVIYIDSGQVFQTSGTGDHQIFAAARMMNLSYAGSNLRWNQLVDSFCLQNFFAAGTFLVTAAFCRNCRAFVNNPVACCVRFDVTLCTTDTFVPMTGLVRLPFFTEFVFVFQLWKNFGLLITAGCTGIEFFTFGFLGWIFCYPAFIKGMLCLIGLGDITFAFGIRSCQ